MSKGAADPHPARTAATVVGKSCTEAVFSTTRRHSSLSAVPWDPRAMRRAARIPKGVAAFPSPRRVADRFPLTAAKVSGSRLAPGSSRRSAGRNRAASFLSSSHCFKSSINPDHRHRAPARDRHSSTAAPAPSSAAADTSAMRPHAAAHRTEAVTMAVHINAIANVLTS